jgi:hypothetical protein
MKRNNEKIARRKISFPTHKIRFFFFFFLWTPPTFKVVSPITDVGLLIVAGVSCEASNQLVRSQVISCPPTPRWSGMERR